MCSLNEQDLEIIDELKIAKENVQSVTHCRKCKHNVSEYVIRKNDSYCRKCFLAMVNHKFRTPLGKSRLLRHIQRLLIYFDLKTCSSFSLMHMVKVTCDDTSSKRFNFRPVVLILSELDDVFKLEEVFREIEKFEFETYFVPFKRYLETDNFEVLTNLDDLIKSESEFSNCSRHFKEFKGEIVQIKRTKIIAKTAEYLKCDTVFVPKTADDLSVNILHDIVMGRGAQLTFNGGFIDDRYDANVLKPLKQLTDEELRIYNEIFLLPKTIIVDNNGKSNDKKAAKILNNFIKELQNDFPSTIFTVSGFPDKLKHEKVYQPCEMCLAPIENRSDDVLSVQNIVENHPGDSEHNCCYSCRRLLDNS